MNEVELKFLDINVAEISRKIEALGAVKKYEQDLESYYFVADGFSGKSSHKKGLRVRKIGNRFFITYKDPAKKSDMSVREELEIEVDSFEKAVKLLEKLGFRKGYLTKKHRVHYELGDIAFELDTYDGIPTFLEIETNNEPAMKEVCQKLDLDITDGSKGMIEEIFPEKFPENSWD